MIKMIKKLWVSRAVERSKIVEGARNNRDSRSKILGGAQH